MHRPTASQYSYHVEEPRWTLVAHLDMITPLALVPFLRCLLVLPPWNSYVEATRWSLELNVSHWQLPNEWHDSTLWPLCLQGRGGFFDARGENWCGECWLKSWKIWKDTEIPWFPGRGRNSWQLAAWTGACEEFLTEAGGTSEVSRSQKGMIYVFIHITLQRQKTLYKS